MDLYNKTKETDTNMFVRTRYRGVDGYIPGSTIGNIPTKDESEDNKKAMFWLERHSQKTMVTKKKHLRFQKVAYAMIASCVFFLALFWIGTRNRKNEKSA